MIRSLVHLFQCLKTTKALPILATSNKGRVEYYLLRCVNKSHPMISVMNVIYLAGGRMLPRINGD